MLFSLCRILISTESKRVIVVAILLVWYSSASSSHAVAEDAAMLETIEGMDSLYSSGLSVRGKLTKSVEGSNDPPEISLLEYTCRFGQKSLRLVPESPTIPSREGALSVAKRLVPGYKPRGDGRNASGIGEEAIVFHDGRSVVVRSIPVFKYRDDADKPQQLPSTAIRDVQDQDSYAFTLLPLVVELGLGRGFTRRFEEVPHVALNNKTADAGSGVEQIGVVTVVADGFGLAPIDKGTWTLELDSRAAYLARSASFSSDKGAGLVIKTSGIREIGVGAFIPETALVTLVLKSERRNYSLNFSTFELAFSDSIFETAVNFVDGPLPKGAMTTDFRAKVPEIGIEGMGPVRSN